MILLIPNVWTKRGPSIRELAVRSLGGVDDQVLGFLPRPSIPMCFFWRLKGI